MNRFNERVLVAVPARDGMVTARLAVGMASTVGLWEGWQFLEKQSAVPIARNDAVEAMLEKGFERLVFVDADIEFDRPRFERLINHDLDIVGALYRKRCHSVMWCYREMQNGVGATDKPADGGLFKVRSIGTGFLSIRRRVFEKLAERAGVRGWLAAGKPRREWFSMGVWGTEYLTEDYMFCEVARDAGFDVWLDSGLLVKHYGMEWYG
jgi:hypothetical protein